MIHACQLLARWSQIAPEQTTLFHVSCTKDSTHSQPDPMSIKQTNKQTHCWININAPWWGKSRHLDIYRTLNSANPIAARPIATTAPNPTTQPLSHCTIGPQNHTSMSAADYTWHLCSWKSKIKTFDEDRGYANANNGVQQPRTIHPTLFKIHLALFPGRVLSFREYWEHPKVQLPSPAATHISIKSPVVGWDKRIELAKCRESSQHKNTRQYVNYEFCVNKTRSECIKEQVCGVSH